MTFNLHFIIKNTKMSTIASYIKQDLHLLKSLDPVFKNLKY